MSTPLMKRKIDEIVDDIKISKNTEGFLDNCNPSFGNIIRNKLEDMSEFIGYGRLDDGTPVMILGVTKEHEKTGDMMMPVRIIRIPKEEYEDRGKKAVIPQYKSKETRDFLSREKDFNY